MKDPAAISVAIVDDDESVCRSLGRLLRANGMTPTAFPSAEAFLSDGLKSAFDCLVLDIQLDGMSGIELQRKLADRPERIPVIFITAYDEPEVREHAITLGCVGYFRKTDSGTDVIDAIRRAEADHRDRSATSLASTRTTRLPAPPSDPNF